MTTEGETHPLPQPFFVIATQNPVHQIGTFPLPESQLDRFLMRLHMGYPDRAAERALLLGQERRSLLQALKPVLDPETLLRIQAEVPRLHVSEALVDYLQALLAYSREAPLFRSGLSPRAGLALLRCAQAWALLEGRDHVLPEDVQAVLPAVAGHRLQPAADHPAGDGDLSAALLEAVPVP